MSDRPDYWRQTKFIELIENIENIENIETIESITAIAAIALVNRLALVDAITNIVNVQSIDLIDAITNIVNIESIDLIDRITLIDTITTIGTISQINKVRGLNWYDRNAGAVLKQWYQFEVDPHALAERWAYTVPTGKMALVEVMQSSVHRTKAATSASYAGAYVRYTPSGEAYGNFLEAFLITNAVGDRADKIIGHSMLIYAGDKLQGYTYDLSTGGECYFMVNAKITEFDE